MGSPIGTQLLKKKKKIEKESEHNSEKFTLGFGNVLTNDTDNKDRSAVGGINPCNIGASPEVTKLKMFGKKNKNK